MSQATLHLTADNFDQTLKDAGNKPVLVDFFAEWCGPCKMAAPIIDELAEEYKSQAVVAKVDVDASHDLASQYGVMSIPTVIVFKNGQELNKQVGFIGKEGYQKMMTDALDK
ncbi:MAG: thioredoxin [Patescibacteria group bacterium]|nr:thioredoxin [Patescibacteria group bacterium]